MMKRATILSMIIFPVLAIFACGMDSGEQVSQEGDVEWVALKKGKAAPPFSLPDMGGKIVSLSDYSGKVVFLNFWATWCPPCRKEMPSIEKLYQKYKDQDLVVLAVSTDRKGLEIVEPYIRENGFSFSVLLDKDGDVSDSYSVFGLPMTFIIDREGNIVDTEMGEADWFSEESQKYFDLLIGKGAQS